MEAGPSLRIDTKELGMATHVNSQPYWQGILATNIQVVFDTGIVLFVPMALFKTMIFHLEQPNPPEPPK